MLSKLIVWVKPWARRFYWILRPKETWRYIVYWSFSIPSRLSCGETAENQMWASCLLHGKHVAHTLLDLTAGQALMQKQGYPMISCMMVTRERFLLAREAIQCFRRQTYPNKELIVLDDEQASSLKEWIASLQDETIRYIHLPDKKQTLGELRNLAVSMAKGEYVAQWDDDDINHPERLLWQMAAMAAGDAEVSFLHRQLLWCPEKVFLGVSPHFMAENTIVCKKSLLPAYPEVRKGEDTPVCHKLVQDEKVLLCDRPDAYIYVFQGRNTWEVTHFKKLMQQCSPQYRDDAYERKLQLLSQAYSTSFSHAISPRAGNTRHQPAPTMTTSNESPSVLILTPVKNASKHIDQFIKNLSLTHYPNEKISLAFLESDSSDDSYAKLEACLPALRARYKRVELYQHSFHYQTSANKARWEVSEQRQRRTVLARSRNLLLSRALRDEAWVLWIDVDVAHWEADVLLKLLQSGKDIVVPHCVKQDGSTFDLNTFKLREDAASLDWQRYVIDGILQPPVGYGRYYLQDFPDDEFVELDGVGGTMLLIRADLHREGLNFPVQPHRYYVETEGLAQVARDMGYQSWGMPGIEIVHLAD